MNASLRLLLSLSLAVSCSAIHAMDSDEEDRQLIEPKLNQNSLHRQNRAILKALQEKKKNLLNQLHQKINSPLAWQKFKSLPKP